MAYDNSIFKNKERNFTPSYTGNKLPRTFTNKVKAERFTPAGGWNEEFKNVFDFVVNGTGNGAIEAVAGGGKTTALVESIIRYCDSNPGKRAIFIAYNVSIKEEGAKRLTGYPVDVMTCHGLGYRSVVRPENWGGKDRKVNFSIEGDKDDYMVKLAMQEIGNEKEKWDDREALMNLVSKAKTCLAGTQAELISLMDRFGIESSYTRSEFAKKALKILNYTQHNPGGTMVPGAGQGKGKLFQRAIITFDDQVWLPVVNNWNVDQYDAVFVDEAQDLSPARRELVRKSMKPDARLFIVGDRHQCVHEDTLISTPNGKVKVADIKPGDKVISWRNNKLAEQTVRYVVPSSCKDGLKVTTASGKELSMTHNHKIWASSTTSKRQRLVIKLVAHGSKNTTVSFEWSEKSLNIKNKLESNDIKVTSVKKDGRYRVRGWYPSYREALSVAQRINTLVAESFIVEKLHTPKECLNLLTASALHVGERIAIMDGNTIATEEIVSIDNVSGNFIDLDVDDASNFFGGDILSHNCIYSFAGADINSLPSLIKEFNCTMLPLSRTWRCGNSIVEEAKRFNPDIKAADDAHDGLVDTCEHKDLEILLRSGDALISRKNAPLVRMFFRLARKQIRVEFIGKDYGRMLAYRIKGWQQRFERIDDLGRFNGHNLLEQNDRWLDACRVNANGDESSNNARQIDEHATIKALTDGLVNDLSTTASVAEVLDRCSMFSPEEKRDDEKSNCITLSSTHRFKGLERDHVYVLADTYLGKTKEENPSLDSLQEEQNLMYVAITRAKKHLTYVHASKVA